MPCSSPSPCNLAGVAELVRGILDGSDGDNGTVLLATGGALWVTM